MKQIICAMALLVTASFSLLAQQQQPATPQPSASPSAAASPTPSPSPDFGYLREGLKSMADDSRSLMGWALTIIGASILAIVSTSYLRPISRRFRNVYLLFLPGWLLIALSVYYGDIVGRRHTAAILAPTRRLPEVGSLMNQDFDSQINWFQRGLIVFSIWLVIYLIWWVRVDVPAAKKD